MKIYIWGIGEGMSDLWGGIDWMRVELVGFLDNDRRKEGQIVNGKTVGMFDEYALEEFDFILVSVKGEYDSIRNQLLNYGVQKEKILCYYDEMDSNFDKKVEFINPFMRTVHLWERKLKKYELRYNNLQYEIADRINRNNYQFPNIKSSVEALNRIIEERCSVCRYGDGEFETIFARKRAFFQSPDEKLGNRLKEILNCQNEKIMICVADNYGCLDKYTEKAADMIRTYMTESVRKDHYNVLDMNRVYYDAYVSRPYILYEDKSVADKIFELWKLIWNDQQIVFVEGEFTRNGYKNDLYANAKTIERVLCPAENAWDKYDEIVSYIVDNVSKEKLILISLGPTATVLAYDLHMAGFRAIDLGHLDNEYEWYQRGVTEKTNIEYKYVNEGGMLGRDVSNKIITDKKFETEVVCKIL